MKTKKSILIYLKKNLYALILFYCNTTFSQTSDNISLVNQTIEKYKKQKSISYEIDYMIKFFDDDKPYKVNASVSQERIDNNSIFKSAFLYQIKDSISSIHKYYDTKFLYMILHNEERIIRFNSKKGETSPIKGSADGRVLDTYFSNIEKLEKKLNNDNIIKKFKDSSTHLIVNFKYADDEDFHGKEENIFFNKKEKTIDKITYIAKYKDQIQKNHWILNNILFDKASSKELMENTNEYFKNYKIEDFKPLTEKDYQLLENGKLAPDITGKIFPNYKNQITLKSDKILILDFWYTSCMPCIKAIPILNQLKANFKNQIEIIGINPIENKEKHFEKIKAFLNRTPIDYPIFLVEEIPKELNIRAYPTLYIIGKDGKVKFSKIGSADNLYNEMESIIKELIDE